MTQDLTTAEAAEQLQVAERTIRNWIDEGVIYAYKLNPKSKSAYRIPIAEVQRILTARAKPNQQQSRK